METWLIATEIGLDTIYFTGGKKGLDFRTEIKDSLKSDNWRIYKVYYGKDRK